MRPSIDHAAGYVRTTPVAPSCPESYVPPQGVQYLAFWARLLGVTRAVDGQTESRDRSTASSSRRGRDSPMDTDTANKRRASKSAAFRPSILGATVAPRSASVCSSAAAHDGQAPSLTPTWKIGGQPGRRPPQPGKWPRPRFIAAFFDSSRRECVPPQGVHVMHALLAWGGYVCAFGSACRVPIQSGAYAASAQGVVAIDRQGDGHFIRLGESRPPRAAGGLNSSRPEPPRIDQGSSLPGALGRDGAEAGQRGGRGAAGNI